MFSHRMIWQICQQCVKKLQHIQQDKIKPANEQRPKCERKFKQLITLCHGRSSITMATESSNKCYLTKCIKKIHYICKKASSYSFRTFRRMSTSFSTEASSKSCRRKLLRRSTIPHSGQFADPRINTTSTQFSHLFNQHKGKLAYGTELKHKTFTVYMPKTREYNLI